MEQDNQSKQSALSPSAGVAGSAKIWGVTYRGKDCETRAYMQDGRVWISDGEGGWLRCHPGVESVFSPNQFEMSRARQKEAR